MARSVSSIGGDEAEDASLRTEISDACRILASRGQGDLIWGHVSVRDPLGRGAWMKASGWGLEEVGPDRVHLIGWDGEILAGVGRRHLEYPIHTEILAARPDINAIVHTHAQFAVAFAATGSEFRPISHDAALFSPPDVARFTDTSDLITSSALGKALARSLGDREAVLLVNHGLVTVGSDLPVATVRAVLMDRASQAHLLAAAAGGARIWSSDTEALSKRAKHGSHANLVNAYEYLIRCLPASLDDPGSTTN